MRDVPGLWDIRRTGAPAERLFTSSGAGRPSRRPNIVFILADDLGWGDLGCYGSLHIRTPHLDALAAGGIRFTDAYSPSPWCSPARMGIYTGRHPGRLDAGLDEPLAVRDDTKGIPSGHPTLASVLLDAGYTTAMFGKWHCGWLPWFSPLKIGYQTFFGNLDGALDYFTHVDTLGLPDLYEGETPVEQEGYYTSLISDRVVDHIASSGDEPFYVQVNYTAPHWPWEGPGDEALAHEILEELRSVPTSLPLRHLDGGSLAKYAEMVEAMDSGIGRILDALDEHGKADDTVVIFCSDNGGERYSFMWPFVGEKGDITEGGIRVPFIVRWPSAISAGQWSDAPIQTTDWTATLIDAAGASPDPGYPLDAVSLLPWLVDGAPFPEHDLFWRTASQGALRRGRWKYVVDCRDRASLGNWPLKPAHVHQLFDLAGDSREKADVARHHTDVLVALRTEWERVNSTLLPYPDDHRNVPRHARPGFPAVSRPD
jgi:arylsulfatase A-like enzyme